KLDPAGKTSIFLFKSHAEEHVGDLLFFKVYSGTVKPGVDLVNATSGNSNRLSGLFSSQGSKRLEIPELRTGDMGAVVKLKDAGPGDTLAEKGHNIRFQPIKFPEPTIRMAVKSLKQGEEDKIGQALYQLHKEDPSLYVEQSQELKQVIIGGQGEEHL